MGSRTLFSSVRSSSPVCGESSSLRRSKAPLVSASSSSQASSSSAGLSSLASMDLALGFLPHKPINKREKGEKGLCGKRKRKGRRGKDALLLWRVGCRIKGREGKGRKGNLTTKSRFRRLTHHATTTAGHQLLTSYSPL